MKNFLIRIIFVVTLLAIGFAAGFPAGNSIGFTKGSEWALVQADILARQVGQFMPVVLEDGIFRVIMKQPRGLHRRAWQLADNYDETIRRASETSTKTEEIVYALHDQTTEVERSSQEVQQQQTADETIYASLDTVAGQERFSQEGPQQETDEVVSPDREMSGTAISAPTSTTI